MKFAFTSVAFLVLFSTFYAQDVIILTNGDLVEARVAEIQLEQIKYRSFNHLDGPARFVAKSDVFLIRYENGTKEMFSPVVDDSTKEALPSPAISRSEVEKAPEPKTELKTNKETGLSSVFGELFYIGVSIPLGELGNEWIGSAGTGFHLGFENSSALSDNFSWIGRFTASHHPGLSEYYNSGGFTNLWMLGGLQYQTTTNSSLALYTNVLGGGNWMLTSGEVNYVFGNSINWSVGGGIGVILEEQFDLGVRYVYAPQENDYYLEPLYTSLLNVSLGYRF